MAGKFAADAAEGTATPILFRLAEKECALQGGRKRRLKLVFRKPLVHPVDAFMPSCESPGQKPALPQAPNPLALTFTARVARNARQNAYGLSDLHHKFVMAAARRGQGSG
jgi:hypothetical protein